MECKFAGATGTRAGFLSFVCAMRARVPAAKGKQFSSKRMSRQNQISSHRVVMIWKEPRWWEDMP